MLILALDTTTSAGSSALVGDRGVVRETASDRTRSQAERLPGELAALLEREGVALAGIDAFAVGTGPGSFTGLRVGIATMQGLATAMGKPLIGVSALDALIRGAGSADHGVVVATWVDAWRGEVFAALYENGREIESPTVALPEALLGRLTEHPVLFTGDGAARYQDAIRAVLGPRARFTEPVAPLLAAAIGEIAADAWRAGDRPGPDAIRPLYVRRSDAELARDRS